MIITEDFNEITEEEDLQPREMLKLEQIWWNSGRGNDGQWTGFSKTMGEVVY